MSESMAESRRLMYGESIKYSVMKAYDSNIYPNFGGN